MNNENPSGALTSGTWPTSRYVFTYRRYTSTGNIHSKTPKVLHQRYKTYRRQQSVAFQLFQKHKITLSSSVINLQN
jgi:hypothetical protein